MYFFEETKRKKVSKKFLLIYVGRLKPDAITYAKPTAKPNVNGIHTPKVSKLTGTLPILSCCIKLPNMSIFL